MKNAHPAYYVLAAIAIAMLVLCVFGLSKCGNGQKIDVQQSAKDSLSGVISQLELKAANQVEVIADYEAARNEAKIEAAVYKSKYEKAKAQAGRDVIVVQQVVSGEQDTTTQADYCQPLLSAADSVIDAQQREIEVAVKELEVWADHDSTTRTIIAAYKRTNELSEEQLSNMRKAFAKQERKRKWSNAGFAIGGGLVGFAGGFLTGKFTK